MTTEGVYLLVIGVGNELRGDDRAGRVVADRIEELDLPGVSVRSMTQLVPELALDLAGADRAVFVDADVDVLSLVVGRIGSADNIEPAATGPMTHQLTPAALLGLAIAVGPRVPAMVEQFSIPATGFDLDSPLSTSTVAAVERAVELIVDRASGTGLKGRSEAEDRDR